ILIAVLAPPALAQDYRFNLRQSIVHLFINPDGRVHIVYDLTIAADAGSDPLDVFDIGLPNNTYDLSEVSASIDGVSLDRVSDSPYIDTGIAVELGSQAIRPGQTGTLHVEATVRNMIFQDSDDSEYASLEFAPNYFSSDFVHGTTYLEVNFHFPPGVTSDEPRYHSQPFTDARVEDNRVIYTWADQDASGSQEYVFGASFPKVYLEEGVVQTAPAFSLNLDAICSSPVIWFIVIGLGWAFFAVIGSRAQKRRKMRYLPPELAVEGTGIKRGLTAVEAAILLEAPLDRVMTMILFGLVKKRVVAVMSQKPLRLEVLKEQPEGAKLRYYERRFLNAIKEDGTMAQGELRDLAIDLIGDVNKKLTGFSRSESKAYYRDIAARAWQQVEAADTPEVLGERWGEGLEWTMLEDDWDDRTREVFRDRPVVVPSWWWLYRPWAAHTSPAGGTSAGPIPAPAPSGGGTPVTLPTLPGGDFANTVVTGIENAANTVVSGVESFTGKVTQTTNPPPKSSSSSSRGGGYSCACACACAGCACACAGGGR
ncbi:MAG: hypothetical protein M8467_19655, partial [Anaerolineae bacterium]|nr:hypothetical protein [Anaerolineae bacterium]